jgi:hypothetical protein
MKLICIYTSRDFELAINRCAKNGTSLASHMIAQIAPDCRKGVAGCGKVAANSSHQGIQEVA